MADKEALEGLRVLVTRPAAQADKLVSLLEQQGATPVLFPLIEIKAIDASSWPIIDWRKIDWLIFISRNAVQHFCVGLAKKLPARLQCVAVGNGTAQAMRDQGLTVSLQPEISNGSEGLLTLPEMQQLNNQKIVIVRGQGGRELLADTLQARGATIRYIEVYSRQLPKVSSAQRNAALETDILLATSVQSVANLLRIFASTKEQMIAKPLIVLSERIKQYALAQGFSDIVVTDNASDVAIMQRLTEIGAEHGQQQPIL
ncbi:MAG: uroporphyrinogen-III synthase [Methylophaga sp.]|nr:uroporphyrinogen-III synthase [Methylophaga sp.]